MQIFQSAVSGRQVDSLGTAGSEIRVYVCAWGLQVLSEQTSVQGLRVLIEPLHWLVFASSDFTYSLQHGQVARRRNCQARVALARPDCSNRDLKL